MVSGVCYNVFECGILSKNQSFANLESQSDCETCPGKVERLNASDWSISQRKPERDPLVDEQITSLCVLSIA